MKNGQQFTHQSFWSDRNPSILYEPDQSCTRVQISRPDPTRPTKIVTRPDPMTIHDGQKRLSSAYTQVTSSTRKTIRSSYAVVALYQLLPETYCTVTTECRLTCTLETSVVWLSSYLLWFVRGLAIKKVIVKQQLVVLYKYSRQRQSLWLPPALVVLLQAHKVRCAIAIW